MAIVCCLESTEGIAKEVVLELESRLKVADATRRIVQNHKPVWMYSKCQQTNQEIGETSSFSIDME